MNTGCRVDRRYIGTGGDCAGRAELGNIGHSANLLVKCGPGSRFNRTSFGIVKRGKNTVDRAFELVENELALLAAGSARENANE